MKMSQEAAAVILIMISGGANIVRDMVIVALWCVGIHVHVHAENLYH